MCFLVVFARPAPFFTRWSCSPKTQTSTAFLASSWLSTSTLWCFKNSSAEGSDVSTVTWPIWTPCITPRSNRQKSSLARSQMRSSGEQPISGYCSKRGAFLRKHRSSPRRTIFHQPSSLYEQGADFVYIARLHSAHYMAELIARAVQDEDGFKDCRENEFRLLKERKEVLQ